MPNKDYQNLSTQGSGSITKITPFQIKSNDSFGSLAIDLEVFRGQIAAVIGDGYKTDLTTTTGSSVNYISNVSLKTLANQVDASTGSLFRVINNMTVSGSTILGDSSADIVTVNSQITGSLFSIGGGTINSTTIGASGQASGKFTTLSASSDLSIQGNATVQGTLGVTGVSTLGSVNAGTITFTSASITGGAGIVGNLSVTGSLIADNLSIGGGYGSSGVTVSNAGNIQANGTLTVDGASTLTGNATLGGDIVSAAPGGKNIFIGAGANPITIGGATSTVSIPGTGSIGVLTVNNNLTVTGDLTVNGTTTTINSTTVTVDDKNIVLGAVVGATDAGADGGGITLSGSTDHTIIWRDATDAWEFSEHLVSSGNGTKDLGLTANRWRFLYAGTGSFSNGTNTLTARHDAIFGSNVLTVSASAGDVILDDKWRATTTTFGSTAGIKLSSAGSDWTSFNTNFSTQNSILGALNQVASNSSNPRKLTYNISASYASGTSVPVNLGSFSDSVTFDASAITGRSSLVFYNGQLLGSGSTANVQSNPATADYSVDGGLSNFRFGFPVSSGDVVVVKID